MLYGVADNIGFCEVLVYTSRVRPKAWKIYALSIYGRMFTGTNVIISAGEIGTETFSFVAPHIKPFSSYIVTSGVNVGGERGAFGG